MVDIYAKTCGHWAENEYLQRFANVIDGNVYGIGNVTVNGNAGRFANSTQTLNNSGTLFKIGCLVTLSKLRCSNDKHGTQNT